MNSPATPRFLALWFPHLPAERHRRQARDWPADAPGALVARVGNRQQLAAVDAAAAAQGLAAGLPLADARARVPELRVADADPAADAALLARLARRAQRLTPTVVADPPDGLLLEVGGSAHLFGGEAALAARLRTRLTARGLTVRSACAGNPAAARALARFGGTGAGIGALPVEALGLAPEASRALRRLGLGRIDSLARLPRASLAARFGPEAVRALARLLGEAPVPLAPEPPPAPLAWTKRLAEPVLHGDQALRLLEALLETACRALEQRHLGGCRFEARFERSDGAVFALAIGCSRPQRMPQRLMQLFRERLDRLRDPLDPGFGFEAIGLSVPHTAPLPPRDVSLGAVSLGAVPADTPAEEEMGELVDELSARLGREAVRCFLPVDSHVPERAARSVPAQEAWGHRPAGGAPAPGWPTPPAGEPPRRPVLLFDPPQRIEVLAEVPDGPPHRFRWRRRLHQVRLAEGPERIAGEWWRHAPGRRALTRDYYRVEDGEGRRFWLFRHGLYDETAAPAWYLHGLFA